MDPTVEDVLAHRVAQMNDTLEDLEDLAMLLRARLGRKESIDSSLLYSSDVTPTTTTAAATPMTSTPVLISTSTMIPTIGMAGGRGSVNTIGSGNASGSASASASRVPSRTGSGTASTSASAGASASASAIEFPDNYGVGMISEIRNQSSSPGGLGTGIEHPSTTNTPGNADFDYGSHNQSIDPKATMTMTTTTTTSKRPDETYRSSPHLSYPGTSEISHSSDIDTEDGHRHGAPSPPLLAPILGTAPGSGLGSAVVFQSSGNTPAPNQISGPPPARFLQPLAEPGTSGSGGRKLDGSGIGVIGGDSGKEKKSKKLKNSKRHHSSPDLMSATQTRIQVPSKPSPSSSAVQSPQPANSSLKKIHKEKKSSSSKHGKKHIVGSDLWPDELGQGVKDQCNGGGSKEERARSKRSLSHSSAKGMFDAIFHRRLHLHSKSTTSSSRHRLCNVVAADGNSVDTINNNDSGHIGNGNGQVRGGINGQIASGDGITSSNAYVDLYIGQTEADQSNNASRSQSHVESDDPQAVATLLHQLDESIANLRHQHSSILTLIPMYTSARGSPKSSPTGETSDHLGAGTGTATVTDLSRQRTTTAGGRTPRKSSFKFRSPPDQSNPAAASSRARSRSNSDSSSDTNILSSSMAPSRSTAHGRAGPMTTSGNLDNRRVHIASERWNGSTFELEPTTSTSPYKLGHTPRASLTSLYNEVASIYFDAEVVSVSSVASDTEQGLKTNQNNTWKMPTDADFESALVKAAEQEEARRQTVTSEPASPKNQQNLELQPITPTSSASPPSTTAAMTKASARQRQPVVWRTRLPVPAPSHEPSLIGMLRKNVGKDLSSISFGVEFNEPLSLLQRMAEECEYTELLRLAAVARDSIERLTHVAAFAVSQYANGKHRTSRKPYNPLLGETFELIREDEQVYFISEKVHHHPPILACHANGQGFVYDSTSAAKNKLSGMSLEIQPLGKQSVTLTTTGETYTWSRPSSFMRNLVAGTKYLETIGDLILTSSTGEKCVITFHAAGWTGKGNQVTGICYGRDGSKQAFIEGSWDAGLSVRYGTHKDPPHSLWKVNPWTANYAQNYGMTTFGLQLNQIPPDADTIAPSDSRFRPDQRLLEEGKMVEADRIKKELEDQQRQRKADGKDMNARWFTSVGKNEWLYTGSYWEDKEKGVLQEKAARLW